jgi:hypothetical protein
MTDTNNKKLVKATDAAVANFKANWRELRNTLDGNGNALYGDAPSFDTIATGLQLLSQPGQGARLTSHNKAFIASMRPGGADRNARAFWGDNGQPNENAIGDRVRAVYGAGYRIPAGDGCRLTLPGGIVNITCNGGSHRYVEVVQLFDHVVSTDTSAPAPVPVKKASKKSKKASKKDEAPTTSSPKLETDVVSAGDDLQSQVATV